MLRDFLKFFDEVKKRHKDWTLEVYYSDVIDWSIVVEYSQISPKHGERIICVQNCDIEYAFAKAQVELKDWLSEHDGGY